MGGENKSEQKLIAFIVPPKKADQQHVKHLVENRSNSESPKKQDSDICNSGILYVIERGQQNSYVTFVANVAEARSSFEP